MKLSDAIRLGIGLFPQGTEYDNCAIGTAVAAIGRHWKHGGTGGPVAREAVLAWPFLESEVVHPLHEPGRQSLLTVIGDLNGFDELRWTRERIADWVSKIEPKEQQPITDALVEVK